MGDVFFINLIKAFAVIAGTGVIFGVICLIASYYADSRNVREEYSGFSTTLGNALFIIQSIFEPQAKYRTEHIIWVKKRRTPAEKKVPGLPELHYDKISIRGIKSMKIKRYHLKP